MFRESVDIRKTTDNFKPLTDEQVLSLANDVYDDYTSNEKLFEDLKNVLNPDVLEYSSSDRKPPKYASGFLDKPFLQGGMPVREKDRLVVEAVLSGNYTFIEIEGGVRGGKDVIALFAWSKYLMTCRDKTHLAVGSSLEHVLRTVLMSSGFGLWTNIPHGVFIRESVSGAQRGVYKFLDAYGLEKEILFYGNEKENDGNKFQGFTLGSVYINETLNQHLNGLDQSFSRIGTSKQPLMIMTQNPEGENAPFYTIWEKPKLTTIENVKKLEFIRDNYKNAFEIVENRLKFGHEDEIEREKLLKERGIRWRDLERKEVQKMFLAQKGKSHYKYLDVKDQITLNEQLLDVNFRYDQKIRNIPVEFFYPYLTEKDYLYGKSMKKVVNYMRGETNPNKIINAYDFWYSHYTIDDNMSLNEMKKREFKNGYLEGSAYHDQKVLGLRRSTEGAVYPNFDKDNLLTMDYNDYDWTGKERIFTIDPGFNDPTGITEKAFDSTEGTIDYLRERLIDFNYEYTDKKSLDTIYYELLKLIRSGGDRQVDAIIVDPSKPELINYLEDKGFSVFSANNRNWTTSQKEKETSEEITKRELRGIPLVATAVGKKKIRVHEVGCPNLIMQIGSYTYDMIEDKNAHGDDLVVHLKYDINTLNVTPAMWTYADTQREEGADIDEQSIVSRNGSEESSEWNLEREITQAFDPFREFSFEQDDDGEDEFFSNEFGGFYN